VLVQTLRIDASPSGSTSLTGDVRKSGSGGVIAGAHVHLYGATGECERARWIVPSWRSAVWHAVNRGDCAWVLPTPVRDRGAPGDVARVTIPMLEMALVARLGADHREAPGRRKHCTASSTNAARTDRASTYRGHDCQGIATGDG